MITKTFLGKGGEEKDKVNGSDKLFKGGEVMKTKFFVILVMLLTILIAMPTYSALAAKAIVIGSPLSTGFPDGVDAERALKLAVEEINAAGGVNVAGKMRLFKLEVMDSRDLEPGVPVSEALLAVEKLILGKGANFIIGGPIRSEAALAAMSLVSQYKRVSIISAGVLSPRYHKQVAKNYDKYKYCFRMTGNVVTEIKESVGILETIKKKHGFNKIFTMVQDVAHARAAGGKIKDILAEKGWNVVGFEKYPTGSTDFSAGLLKAKSAGAQSLFYWFDMPEISILTKQWSDMKIAALPVGFGASMADSTFWTATKGKCAYWVNVWPRAGCSPSEAIPLAAKFIKAYKGKYGVEPGVTWVSPVSYQAVYVLADAIERAGSIESGKVVAALEKTDLKSVWGKTKFDPRSHQIIYSSDPQKGALTTWAQWLDGKRVAVFPPKIATADIKLPPWVK
jgi:branched-chain amino acid transport system substrate-binding protein